MPIGTGFLRILTALVLSIPVFLSFAYYLGALAIEETLLEPQYVVNSLDQNDVYGRIYEEVLLSVEFEEWIDRLVGGFNVSKEEKVQLLRQVIPPEYIEGETERNITVIVEYLNNRNNNLSVFVDLSDPLQNIRPVVLGFIDNRIDSLEQVKVSTPEALSREIENFLLVIAQGNVPEHRLAIDALSASEWREAYSRAFDAISQDPLISERIKFAISTHEQEILDTIAVGDVDTALKLASRTVTDPLIDDAIEGLKINLDDRNRLDLVREVAEDSNRGREQVVRDANLMRFIIQAGTGNAAHWTALGLMVLFTLMIAAVFIPYWKHVFFWPSATLFISGLLLLVSGVFFILDIPTWAFWICQNNGSPSCLLSLDVVSSLAFGFGVDFIPPSAIVLVVGCLGVLVSIVIAGLTKNRPVNAGEVNL